MELAFILGLVGLGLWLWVQTQRIEKLSRKVGELESRLSAIARAEAERLPPLLLDQPLPPDETEPLVLDTPLPAASNDTEPAPSPVSTPPLEAAAPSTRQHADTTPAAPPSARSEPPGRYLQAIGVAAIVAALSAPLANATSWQPLALTLYVCLAGAAGLALAMWRRWPWAAIAAVAGLHFWFAASIALDAATPALAFIGVASVGGAALALRAPLAETGMLTWAHVRALGPGVVISIGGVLLIWTWLAVAPAPSDRVAGPAFLGAFHVVLAAHAVRMRAAAPAALGVAIAALVLGFIAYMRARFFIGPPGEALYPTLLIAALVVVLAALAARPYRQGRASVAAAGAIGAAALVALAAFSRPDWHSPFAWAALFTAAAVLVAAAWRTSVDLAEPRADHAVSSWGYAGAALSLLAVESALPAQWRPAGDAALALAFTAGFAWRGWRPLHHAILAAAVIGLGHALAMSVGSSPWVSLAILALGAITLFTASRVAGRSEPQSVLAELLNAAAALFIVIAAAQLLRWAAARIELGVFIEAALLTLLLLTAGFALAPRRNRDVGAVGAWFGHALFGAGLVYALFTPGLALNPWWGGPARAVIDRPPLYNALALAFAAPAAFAFVAARLFYARQIAAARFHAAAGGMLALIWIALELRHVFHGAEMSAPAIGLFEAACYALLALAGAVAIALAARTGKQEDPFARDLSSIAHGCAWAGLAISASILLVARHPWWGAQDPTTTNALSTLLAVLAQAPACALALALGRLASTSRSVEPARFAAASAAALFAWSFGHAAIRWLYHRGYMDDGAALAGLEGFAHALWPLIFISGAAFLTARAPGRDTVRAYLFDLQAIWGTAIWPALAFAAVGLWALSNPWWGILPAQIGGATIAPYALAGILIAAWLSALATRIPHVRRPQWMIIASALAWRIHLLVALTLVVRWLHHPNDMRDAPVAETEMWSYAATWAVSAAAAWFMRPKRLTRDPGLELLPIKPSTRRERRHGRRQRSK